MTRLGEKRPRPVDVKLVAATHADLEAAVREGSFRADLYARLNPAARLVLPPLRERVEDLEALARVFVERLFARPGSDRALLEAYQRAAGLEGPVRARLHVGAAPEAGEGVVFVFGEGTLGALRRHPWPGNVRELELLVANATLMALADAAEAVEQGRRSPLPHAVPVPARLSWPPRRPLPAAPVSARPRSASTQSLPRAARPARRPFLGAPQRRDTPRGAKRRRPRAQPR